MKQLSPTGYQISNFEAQKQQWGWWCAHRWIYIYIYIYIYMRLYELFFFLFFPIFLTCISLISSKRSSDARKVALDVVRMINDITPKPFSSANDAQKVRMKTRVANSKARRPLFPSNSSKAGGITMMSNFTTPSLHRQVMPKQTLTTPLTWNTVCII